jgi:signal transduction histidine kinase
LDERLLIVDLNKNSVVWLSSKFNQAFPYINTSSSFDEVLKLIDDCNPTSEEIKNIIENNRGNLSSCSRFRCEQYEAEFCNLDHDKILFRLKDISLVDEAFGRHLADREKLIFSASSITVSEMASTIAHEINQPIGTINNLLQGIRDRLLDNETHDEKLVWAIDKSIEQARYTAEIISRVRDYTRNIQPKIEGIDINVLIDKSISLMDWEVRNTKVSIDHKKLASDVLIKGDQTMLQQVIVNLIRNGIESIIHNEKYITIKTINKDNYIKISIKDNGKGISNDELDSIFMPFTSQKNNGMGIGLNICRSFIELHRGKIWLTQNEDCGCTSHILLPVYSEVPK